MTKTQNNKLWGGRFEGTTDQKIDLFNASITFDYELATFDIQLSIAHANMLQKIGVITEAEKNTLIEGLHKLGKKIDSGEFQWSVVLEDVHMNIEQALTDEIGELGKKLHTGRSRNDQVATDLRLYLRFATEQSLKNLENIANTLLTLAEKHTYTYMPGYTHLQNAQPITFAHHLMAYFEMSLRDIERFTQTKSRTNTLPLGSGALAGTPYPIDREYLAKQLGFTRICQNSLDAVSDRDFVIEFAHNAALVMMHLSRFCEEIILWMSDPFRFVSLPDHLCTGSSMMPQKKNPDLPELIRGKTGRVYGHLMSLLTLMKSQPLAYNKDNQEDKIAIFDTCTTLMTSTDIFVEIIKHLKPNEKNMKAAATRGYTNATDLADYLVRQGEPFRDAHHSTGKIVQFACEKQCPIEGLGLEVLQKFSPKIKDDVFQHIALEKTVEARNTLGGTAPKQVQKAIENGHARLCQLLKTSAQPS